MPTARRARNKGLIDRQWYCAALATPVHPKLAQQAAQCAANQAATDKSNGGVRSTANVQQHSLSMTAMAKAGRPTSARQPLQRLQLSQEGLQQAWDSLRASLANRSPLLYQAMGKCAVTFLPPEGAQVVFSSENALNQCSALAQSIVTHMQQVFARQHFALNLSLSTQGQQEAAAEKAKRLVGTRDDNIAFINALRQNNPAADALFQEFDLSF